MGNISLVMRLARMFSLLPLSFAEYLLIVIRVHSLAPYADTDDGKLFAEKLWTETVDVCAGIDNRARNGLLT